MLNISELNKKAKIRSPDCEMDDSCHKCNSIHDRFDYNRNWFRDTYSGIAWDFIGNRVDGVS